MAIINKNDLKQLSNNTYIDNTVGAIRPQDVRFFNDTLIDSIVDETDYVIDSASWNSDITNLTNAIANIVSNTGSFVLNSQTSSMSVATASYVDLRGDNVTINYANGWIEITGSESNAQVIVSDTAPNNYTYPTGTLWFNSTTTAMYVNYCSDPLNCTWIGVSAAGPVISASHAETASIALSSSYSVSASYFFTSSVTSASIARTAQTASYFITSSVTSASRADIAGYAEVFFTSSVTNATNATYAASASWIDIVGKGIEINKYFSQYQLTASNGASVTVSDTAPITNLDSGSLWYNSLNGGMYVWYIDADSSQWVSVNMVGPVVSASYARSSSLSATASYINVTGSGVLVNWNGSQLQLTGSGGAEVIISDTAPLTAEPGQLWFNSINTSMYVYYDDGVSSNWIGVAGSGPVVSASYSVTSSHAILANTATFALAGGNQDLESVIAYGNTTTGSIDIREKLLANKTGSGTFTQGLDVEAIGVFSHAQGYDTRALDRFAHAEGMSTTATADGAHSEGINTEANGLYSHAEGEGTNANGQGSHTEGYESITVGRGAHAEGTFTLAEGNYSHAEGESTWAYGRSSHAQGLGTVAQGIASNTEGRYTNAAQDYQSVVGQYNIPLSSTENQSYFIVGDGSGLLGDPNRYHNLLMAGDGVVSISGSLNVEKPITGSVTNAISASYVNITGSGVIVNYFGSQIQLTSSASPEELDTLQSVTTRGNHTTQSVNITASLTNGVGVLATGLASHAEGSLTTAIGAYSHAEGGFTFARGVISHAEGNTTTAVGSGSHSEGLNTRAVGDYSHTEGQLTVANGVYSHTEGRQTTAIGSYSHAEGLITVTNGAYSHAEGDGCIANGSVSHAEGGGTVATGFGSHAEGYQTTTIGQRAHSEGQTTTAIGLASHAEGQSTISSGSFSHSEGDSTIAIGFASHAEGQGTIAQGNFSHASGKWNIPINEEGITIIGDGVNNANRSNVFTAGNGKVTVTGSLFVNGVEITGGGGGGNQDLQSVITNGTVATSSAAIDISTTDIAGGLYGVRLNPLLVSLYSSVGIGNQSSINLYGGSANIIATNNVSINAPQTILTSNTSVDGELTVTNGLKVTGSLAMQTTLDGYKPIASFSLPIEINGTIYYINLYTA